MANPTTAANRRGFLNLLTELVLGVIGLAIAVPAVAYFVGPLRRKGDGKDADFLDAGALSDIPIGKWQLLSFEVVRQDGWKKTRTKHAAWVRRQGAADQAITVLSSICPHLGCPINWHPDQSQFVCPCHGGIFNQDGRNTGGPPPRAMDPLEHEVRGGRLWIQWVDFKIGVPERIVVSV
jgi:Rieske Fe-S protein